MRHRHAFRKLNITDGAHRRSMLRHMGCALLLRESIRTTLPRAKELRRFVEPLITLGKKPSLHNRRLAFARLQNRQLVAKLFDDLGARFESRPGGYVRILKHGFRKGDNAPMAWVELTDKNPEAVAQAAADDLALAKKAAAKKSAKKSSKAGMMKSSDKAALEKLAAEAEAKDADSADDLPPPPTKIPRTLTNCPRPRATIPKTIPPIPTTPTKARLRPPLPRLLLLPIPTPTTPGNPTILRPPILPPRRKRKARRRAND